MRVEEEMVDRAKDFMSSVTRLASATADVDQISTESTRGNNLSLPV